jgi:hypothetical protein
MRKYTKKVIVTDEKSTKEARAERVRRIRNLSNLTRKEICNDGTININTFKGWEIGRYGGLPADGAEKIVARVSKEGVKCTPEWLLYGSGAPPQVITDFTPIKNVAQKDAPSPEINTDEQEKIILDELLLFRKSYKDIVYIVVSDDSMMPCYKPGEYVAGVNHYGDKIHDLVGRDCIVQTEEGKIFLRTLREGNQNHLYTLICTNTQTTLKEPVLYNIKLFSAAPVTRHYSCRLVK